jgi:hypothetical protein
MVVEIKLNDMNHIDAQFEVYFQNIGGLRFEPWGTPIVVKLSDDTLSLIKRIFTLFYVVS